MVVNTMPITTKTGDKGKTDLFLGPRVAKDDLRVEAYGTLDELCSLLGLAKSFITAKKVKCILETIQRDLFILGSEIGVASCHRGKLKKKIDASHVQGLDEIICGLEKNNSCKTRSFCLPGGNTISSSLDIARTVARRAERCMVTLKRKRILQNGQCLVYLNRTSDLLYLLARSYDKKTKRV